MSGEENGDRGARDGGSRRWAPPVVGVLAAVLVVAAGGGALFVVSIGTGCACQPPGVAAGVQFSETDAGVRAAFTSNADAGHLLVRADPEGGAVAVDNTTGNATVTDDGVRLPRVGATVTFAPGDPAPERVTLTVVAHPPSGGAGEPTTIAVETFEL